MVRCDLLKGKIAENGMSQSDLAKRIGITPKTFYKKMKDGVFNSNEIYVMIELLKIENPTQIFFAQKVS